MAITELPKTTRNISTFNLTRANHCQITRKNCRILHINRRWKLFSTHTVDLLKILDVNQRLKRRHGAPAFQTIFDEDVFGLVRDQHQFPSRRINFIPRTYFVRPKTLCCQQQSSQYPIFPSQTRDQSFIRPTELRSRERSTSIPHHIKSDEGLFWKSKWNSREKRLSNKYI